MTLETMRFLFVNISMCRILLRIGIYNLLLTIHSHTIKTLKTQPCEYAA